MDPFGSARTPLDRLDADRVDGLKDIRHGGAAARKGWLEPTSVVNTRSLEEVRKLLG